MDCPVYCSLALFRGDTRGDCDRRLDCLGPRVALRPDGSTGGAPDDHNPSVPKGQQVTMIGTANGGAWAHVKVGNLDGYMDLVQLQKPAQ